jgi:hypothetical protein
MNVEEALKTAAALERDTIMATQRRIVSRSPNITIEEAKELYDSMKVKVLSTDPECLYEDERQILQARADREALRRRRESFEALASEFTQRDYSRSFPRNLKEHCISAAENLMMRLTVGGDDRPLKMDTNMLYPDFLRSLGCTKRAAVGWVNGDGVPVDVTLLIGEQFRDAYQPLNEACTAWLKVPAPATTPDNPSDEKIESLRQQVDAMDPVDAEMTELGNLLVGGYQLFIARLAGPERIAIQTRVVEHITKIHGDLLTRIRSRRVAVGV